MKNKIRTIFIGTPGFGLPALQNLIKDASFDVVGIITQPDKPVGRKQIITSPPIKIEGEKNNIPVFQPEKICCIEGEILNLKPNLIVVAAYAQIIPEKILDIPKYGSINIHGSLLPKYRGASCIQASIINGDTETGVTIMKMDIGLDTGDILAQNSLKIASNDTSDTLYTKVSKIGAELLIPTLKGYIAEDIKPKKQDSSKSSYAKQLKKEDGKINWDNSAEEIERFIRAMFSWPGAWTTLNNKKIKILKATIEAVQKKNKIGELFIEDNQLAVQCSKDILFINNLQLEGKKETTGKEFIKGYKDLIGKILE